MIRLLVALVALGLVAFGFSWIADRPGGLVVTFGHLQFETSLPVAVAALLALFVCVWLAIGALRLVVSAPGMFSAAGRRRNVERGRQALTRGMIAAAAGDARGAQKASLEASRRLRQDPLALLLEAQYAQMSEDRAAAARLFRGMSERSDMRLLGLRGLHAEAVRAGDAEAAHEIAKRANAIAPLPWATRAVLDYHTAAGDWTGALEALDSSATRKAVDKATADRHRAVLSTACALQLREREPDKALALSREALALAPGLVPAAVTAAEVYARRQEVKRAARTIEAAWRVSPHPDLARAYLSVRPGDSARDRLQRAESLARIHRDDPESHMLIARAALEARSFLQARRAMAPLIETGRPTRRMYLLMADIEEAEHGVTGALREWLARAARAPRDPAWVADGVVSDVWAPVSPITGRLDAFVWRTPDERLSGPDAPLLHVLPNAPEPEPPVAEGALAQPAALEPPDEPDSSAPGAPEDSGRDGSRDGADPSQAEDLRAKDLQTKGAPIHEIQAPPPAPAVRTAARPVFFPHPQAPDDPGATHARPLDDAAEA